VNRKRPQKADATPWKLITPTNSTSTARFKSTPTTLRNGCRAPPGITRYE